MVQSADRRLVSEATLSNSGSVARSILNGIYASKNHTHTTDQIADFSEIVRDVVAAMITSGYNSGISITYDDVNDRLSFAVTGVGGGSGGTGLPEIGYDTDGQPYLIGDGSSSGGGGGSLPTEIAYDTDSAPYLLTSSSSVPTGAEISYDTDGTPYMVTTAGSVPTGSEIAYDTDGNPYLL